MTASTRTPAPSSSLDAQGILLILFRHKWKILFLALLGVGTAAAVYLLLPPVYESSAKILVRYVLERSAIDSVDSKDGTSGSRSDDGIINSEVEILTSWDLAAEVAETVGAERLASKAAGVANKAEAARSVSQGLTVSALKGSNVISISYRNPDPELASLVLSELLNKYFTKHLEVHRSVGAFDFVTQQTDQVRGRLRQTEDELKQFKSKAGIISLPATTATLGSQLGKSQEELLVAEAERAEQLARVKELEKWLSGGGVRAAEQEPKASAESDKAGHPSAAGEKDTPLQTQPPSNTEAQRYDSLNERLARLRQVDFDLLAKYTPENELVLQNQRQMETLDRQKRELERRFPSLASTAPAKSSSKGSQIDLVSERARLAAVEAKAEILRAQVRMAQDHVKQFSEIGTQISELERRKEVEETNYKYFESSLEKARIDEALDPSKIPNINVVQKPSPPAKVVDKLRKMVLGIAAGGLGLGIAIAMLIDLLIDKSVKAPMELETRLRMPVIRAIPYLSKNGHSSPQLKNGSSRQGNSTGTQIQVNGSASKQVGRLIRPFCNEIRDRIILHFEINRLNHKPKLIAVTGCEGGSGISTVAGGLAASLSETGDDKILLVDMNMEREEVHPFFNGSPACLLTEAIEPGKEIVSAADNLYLATAGRQAAAPVYLGPKKFYELLPRLKASDFDYIIFDMPPLSKSSATIAMAGFMDKVLLVVEAEKDKRDAVKRAYHDLLAAKADVSGVVNKTRSYAPKWLGLDA